MYYINERVFLMLIKRTPDRYEKLAILGGMATDDILYPPEQRGGRKGPYPQPKKNPSFGVYRASLPNGKFINLMRVMFTDFCKMDCAYCPNSHWVPRKRYAFKVDELAQVFMEAQQRGMVSGLFLSSGIAGDGSKTTERLVKVVDSIRNRHGFKGYIHLKVMPGADFEQVEAAHNLGTRLSVNMETLTTDHMRKLSNMKDFENDILAPMRWIDQLNEASTGRAVGQATQLVVGAADETDRDVFSRMDQLYSEWNLKRIYYAPFRPVRYTPLEEHPPTPMSRSHRLYQFDWLKRVYRFANDDLDLAFSEDGYLPLDQDPKTSIAVENLDAFPVDINGASREQLLRTPGVGPKSTERIISARQRHTVDTWRDLQAMGVVRKRAWPFIAFSGYRPPAAKQLRMDLFGADAKDKSRSISDEAEGQAAAPCGEPRSCTGCPMFGMPGHPGHSSFAA
ncbi:MAG: radical SAM protein [Dehalococcoidia bacterium]|nr:radical SAM protein [Dehalococcoidia bacterium]